MLAVPPGGYRVMLCVCGVVAIGMLLPNRGDAGDVADIIRDLYGGDGITLSQASGFGHDAHFTARSLQGLDDLGAAIGSDTGLFAFNAVSPAFTIDLETGLPVRTTESLGPLLGNIARTLGSNTLTIGFSYSRIDYKRFEGDDLDDLSVVLSHPDANGDGQLAPFVPFPGGPLLDFELDEVHLNVDLELSQDIFALFANYGLTDDWDVGIIVPVIHVEARARSVATIVDPTPATPSPHFFDPSTESPVSTKRRHATGIGDVLLRSKYSLLRMSETLPDLAVGGQITLPVGDADDLLGTDELFLQAVFLASKSFGRFTPHLNVGYEWSPTDFERSNLRYVAGFDVWLHPRVTVSAGVLGRWEHSGDHVGDDHLDGAIGARFAVAERVLLNISGVVPLLRDDGLLPDFILSGGVELAF